MTKTVSPWETVPLAAVTAAAGVQGLVPAGAASEPQLRMSDIDEVFRE